MIQLQRNIQVRTFDTEATVAVARDRPEFLAVARLAADLGHPISGRDISRELLGNLPDQVGWRVLDRALAMGLLERTAPRGPAELSDSGRAMLDRGAVLVPEEGVWRFFVVMDPLVTDELVHVQRLDADYAKAERDRLYKRKRGERIEQGRTPPQALVEQVNLLRGSWADGAGFEIRDLGERGQEGPVGQLRLHLRWSPGAAPTVSARGRLPSEGKDKAAHVDAALPIAPALAVLDYDELWVTLVNQATGFDGQFLFDWMDRAKRPVMPTTMERWSTAVRRTFSTDLPVPAFGLDELGEFEATKLDGVTLVPSSDEAADDWASWLLWDGIDRYVVPASIEDMRAAVAAKFPHHTPHLPEPHDLVQRARSAPRERTSRFLLAPADLGLWSAP